MADQYQLVRVSVISLAPLEAIHSMCSSLDPLFRDLLC